MALLVCSGAVLRCNMGTSPGSFQGGCTRVSLCHKPAGTVMDHTPNRHVSPFGLCRSLANPSVAAATSAASGALTPQPCLPVLPAPWTPGATRARLERKRALLETDHLQCAWQGTIEVTTPGQGRVTAR